MVSSFREPDFKNKHQTTDSGRIPSHTLQISKSGLIKTETKANLPEYLRQTWALRYFIIRHGQLRAFAGAKGTLLGRLWLILEPFLRVGMYFVIFGLLLNTRGNIENFIAFLGVGIIIFAPMGAALTEGTAFTVRNKTLMKGFSFPRFSLIVSDAVQSFLDRIPEILGLLLFLVIAPPHVIPSWHWVLIVPVLVLLSFFSTGLSMITAVIDLYIPDLSRVWPLVTRFWFYGSGVIFPITQFVEDPTILTLLRINPAVPLLDISRNALIYHNSSSVSLWVQLFGWSSVLFLIGLVVFWLHDFKFNRER